MKKNTNLLVFYEKITPQDETIRGEDFAYELRKITGSNFPDSKQMLAQLPDSRKRKD